jgi:hypothetical protein
MIDFQYDQSSDVLYISDGVPHPALSEEIAPGVLLRFDTVTNDPTAITVLDFLSHFIPQNIIATLCDSRIPSNLVTFLRDVSQEPNLLTSYTK